MKTIDLLKQAREILSKPESWTKGTLFRDEQGEIAPLEDGISFCMVGAIYRASGDVRLTDAVEDAVRMLSTALRPDYFQTEFEENRNDVISFNDCYDTTHEDVIEVFDKAIGESDKK